MNQLQIRVTVYYKDQNIRNFNCDSIEDAINRKRQEIAKISVHRAEVWVLIDDAFKYTKS